jgi:hypothetical protein
MDDDQSTVDDLAAALDAGEGQAPEAPDAELQAPLTRTTAIPWRMPSWRPSRPRRGTPPHRTLDKLHKPQTMTWWCGGAP